MTGEKKTPSGRGRDPGTHGRIRRDPRVLTGKPCVAGTRISVEMILEELAGGLSVETLLESFPPLVAGDVHAALTYALRVLRHEEFYPLPETAA